MRTTALLLLFCLPFYSSIGQRADTLKADSVFRKDFRPTGLRFGGDLIGPIKTRVNDNFSAWEFNADVDLHRYILSADFGSSSLNQLRDSIGYSAGYKNNGRYWRVGIDANFLTRDPDRNVFFLGIRYGRSSYSESMNVMATDTIWGPGTDTWNEEKSAQWFELTSGVKVKLWKFIWMGYTGSLKFALKTDDGQIISYDVPGYGKTAKVTTWGFTYQLLFRIPFRPTRPILPPKKKK